MDRIQTFAPTAPIEMLASILRNLREAFRAQREVDTIDMLPSDRLKDMGVPGRTEQNKRHSGEYGCVPDAQLW